MRSRTLLNSSRLLFQAATSAVSNRERIEQTLALAMRVCGAGLGYVIVALAAHATTTQAFGDFVLLMSSAALFGAVATLGQETILLRDLPLISTRGNAGFRELLGRSIRTSAAGVVVFAILSAAYGYHSFSEPGVQVLAILVCLVACTTWNELVFAIQRGVGHILGAVFVKEVAWKLLLAIGLAGLVLMKQQASVSTIGCMFLVCVIAPLVVSSLSLAFDWHHAPPAKDDALTDQAKPNAYAFFALNFISQAGGQIDVIVLGLMSAISNVELGAYYAAQRTIQVLYLLPYGASVTSAPRIPVAFAAGDYGEIVRLSRQISRGIGAVVIFLCILLFVFRDQVLGLFRPEFANFSILLPALCLGPLISALGGLHGLVAPMCGMEKEYSRVRLLIITLSTLSKILFAKEGMLLALAGVNAVEGIAIVIAGLVLARRKLGVWII